MFFTQRLKRAIMVKNPLSKEPQECGLIFHSFIFVLSSLLVSFQQNITLAVLQAKNTATKISLVVS